MAETSFSTPKKLVWSQKQARSGTTSKKTGCVLFRNNVYSNLVLDPYEIELTNRSPSLGHYVIDPLDSRSLRGSRIGDARTFGKGRLERRDSVAKIAYNTLSSILQGLE
jgi:hypothetical protein